MSTAAVHSPPKGAAAPPNPTTPSNGTPGRVENRGPCIRINLSIPSGGEVSWKKELQKIELANAPASDEREDVAEIPTTGEGASAADGEVDGPAADGAAVDDAKPAEAKPSKLERFAEMARPQHRFQQMIQDMERKYATARPLEHTKRSATDGGGGRKKRKQAKGARATSV